MSKGPAGPGLPALHRSERFAKQQPRVAGPKKKRMRVSKISRRKFAKMSAAAAAAAVSPKLWLPRAAADTVAAIAPLTEFGYGDVMISSALHEAQLRNTHDVLMNLSEDSLLKPFRQMAGQRAPGADLGGWYNYDPDFDWHKDDAGFAPGAP